MSFGNIVKGKRTIAVTDSYGHEFKHMVPMGRNLLVRDGDNVEAAEALCDGQIDPTIFWKSSVRTPCNHSWWMKCRKSIECRE